MRKDQIELLISQKLEKEISQYHNYIMKLITITNQNTDRIDLLFKAVLKLDESIGVTIKAINLTRKELDKEIESIKKEINKLNREILIYQEETVMSF